MRTASSLPVLTLCTFPNTDGVAWVSGGNEEARDLGNAFHARAQARAEGKPLPPVPAGVDADELELLWRPYLAWFEARLVEGYTFEAEIPYALNVKTGAARRLEKGEHRAYVGATEDDFCGTVDLVGFDPHGQLVVIDLKSGRRGLETYDAQLDGLGVAAARAEGRSIVTVAAYRPHAVGNDEWRPRLLDAFDLDDALEVLRHALLDKGAPNPGAWCTERHCGAIAACPAQQAAAGELVAVASSDFHMTLNIVNDEHAVWLRDRAKLVMEAAEQVLNAVKERARAQGGLPVAPGKVWAEVPSVRTSTDAKQAIALAEAKGATPDELSACMRSTVFKTFRVVNEKGRAA